MRYCIRSPRTCAIGWAIAMLVAARAPGEEPPRPAPPTLSVRLEAPAICPGERAIALVVQRDTDLKFPPGGHLQGVQAIDEGDRAWLIVAHDSLSVGYLMILEFPAGFAQPGMSRVQVPLPGDGQSPPLRHAGGFQLAGRVLAVGVEDNQQKTRSEVQFLNLDDPAHPRALPHLTVRRQGAEKEQTAGAVALVVRGEGYLLAVANWDARAIDFYRSTLGDLNDERCRFEPVGRWEVALAATDDWLPDPTTVAYQSIQLVASANGDVVLAGLGVGAMGEETIDLFRVDLAAPAPRVLRKIARRALSLPKGASLRHAGGLFAEGDRWGLLVSPRNWGHETTMLWLVE